MTSKIVARAAAFLFCAAASVNQAFAMGGWPGGGSDHGGGGSGGGGATTAPELDGPGGIAAIAILVSIAVVLFNRSRNR